MVEPTIRSHPGHRKHPTLLKQPWRRGARATAAGLVLAWLAACGGGGAGSRSSDDGAGGGGGGIDGQIPSAPVPAQNDLASPASKEMAMQLVASAENSTLDWRAQYGYIEDIGDGRGYTGGIIGFTSGTGDMLGLVQAYTNQVPGNALAAFLPALRAVNGTASHQGLGDPYVSAWKSAAQTAAFRDTQDSERDRWYFNPSVSLAKLDGLGVLGQFIYYDAAVVHGLGKGTLTLEGIRAAARAKAAAPAQGGDEVAYLHAFLDARVVVMKSEAAHNDVSRIETAQRVFLQRGNLSLTPPLSWKVYGDSFSIAAPGTTP